MDGPLIIWCMNGAYKMLLLPTTINKFVNAMWQQQAFVITFT